MGLFSNYYSYTNLWVCYAILLVLLGMCLLCLGGMSVRADITRKLPALLLGLGVLFIFGAGFLLQESGQGQFASDTGANKLKKNVPYFAREVRGETFATQGILKVTYGGDTSVFVCRVSVHKNKDTTPFCEKDWKLYRLKFERPVPEFFIKISTGEYMALTLQQAKLLGQMWSFGLVRAQFTP